MRKMLLRWTCLVGFVSTFSIFSAQSLTPSVIASAGESVISPDASLMLDYTIGETFVVTLLAPELMLTQGFHQPLADIGCTDSSACNYDSLAVTDDGSCTYAGCTDTLACNYDMNAGCDDGSCEISGCTDSTACNFDDAAACDNGSCLFAGCVNVTACNYDAGAICGDDSLCTFPTSGLDCQGNCLVDADSNDICDFQELPGGCSDITACNYVEGDSFAEDDTCFFGSCADVTACNYESSAYCNDEICTYPGCTDTLACNYDMNAGCDDGSCEISGCTDSTACNFDDAAACDNGSCLYAGCVNELACDYDSSAICGDDSLCTFPTSGLDCQGNCLVDSDSNDICDFQELPGGCSDVTACNYVDGDTIADDDTCFFGGCADVVACNYDESAYCNDGSCTYSGCTEVIACNYDASAGCDDGSCIFPGCGDSAACNFDPLAGCALDSLCTYPAPFYDCNNVCINDADSNGVCDELEQVLGCTDITACNYDSTATQNDGSCLQIDDCGECGGNGVAGCMDMIACNYDSLATCDNGVICTYYGCTDVTACNYDSLASCDDGSCQQLDACGVCGGGGIAGCMDMNACNYNMAATCDDGSCLQSDGCGECGGTGVAGCIVMNACNYNMAATCDDGSCVFETTVIDSMFYDSLQFVNGVVVGGDTLFTPGTVTDTVGMAGACDTIYVYHLILGQEEWMERANVSLYPNPAMHNLQINLGSLVAERIEVYDISSRKVFDSVERRTGIVELNVADYGAGNYIARISAGGGLITKRFEIVR